MRIDWHDLGKVLADVSDGAEVEIAGWMAAVEPAAGVDYFLLSAEPPCCCLPSDPLAAIEVFAAAPMPYLAGEVGLRGRWRVLSGDPTGWRYQLRDARPLGGIEWQPVSRREVLVAGSLFGLAARMGIPIESPGRDAAPQQQPSPPAERQGQRDLARRVIAATATVDAHSHAGAILHVRQADGHAPFRPLAEPMRQGGMAVVCLAIVSDSPTHRVMADGRIHPFREPAPGELYAYSQRGFQRLHDLVRNDGLRVITGAAGLKAARGGGTPSVIIAAEGGDFLDGLAERVDEAYERWQLRHLQLTHYRVNQLGDIQTEAPVHGGLSDAGAEVIRRCNRLGMVVDVAHGTFELVKRAAEVTTKPLVLSHTSLSEAPRARSRLISPDHARVIALTGGVIGIWPPKGIFPDIDALAKGMARLAEVVGPDHVGLGSDMMGLVGASTFDSYAQLPELAEELLAAGFNAEETGKILGGNYARVFAASLA